MSDAEDLREEYRMTILAAQLMHPRSRQKMIGPSGLGTPCTRRLAYALAQHSEVNDGPPSWRATVGTSVHTWLEDAFGRVVMPDGSPRYLVEQRVKVGTIGGQDVWGTCDLYDRAALAAIDHKVVGPSSLKAKRVGGVGPGYRVQRHLYGLGLLGAGHKVELVGNFILPSSGDLHEAFLDLEPFDIGIALDALARAERIAQALQLLPLGPVLSSQETADDYCRSCPWLRRGSDDLTAGCPGHTIPDPAAAAAGQLAGLLPA